MLGEHEEEEASHQGFRRGKLCAEGREESFFRALSVFTVGLDVKEIVIRHAVNAKSGVTDSSPNKCPHTLHLRQRPKTSTKKENV